MKRRWLLVLLLPLTLVLCSGNRAENPVLLGVVTQPGKKNVQVLHVLPGSPAHKGGLKPGDVLIEVNGKKLARTYDIDDALKDVKAGHSVLIKVQRKGKVRKAMIPVIARSAYKGDFLKRVARGATGMKAAPWFAHSWGNIAKGKKPPTRKNTRGKVVVIHTFQSW